ncbi:MAG: family 43 glycosylhydrolase [Pirellulales bacterium]|nr:family 43 glycosylhydrolase [Pirellulales bacterium]
MRKLLSLSICLAAASCILATAASALADPPAPKAAGDRPLVELGEKVKVYDPNVGEDPDKEWYINDHCLIYGPDNHWHLYGITHYVPLKPKRGRVHPMKERLFAHAMAKEIQQQPWEKRPHALTYAPEKPWGEEHLWAPHVIEHEGTYYMFYCAGNQDHTKYKIHLATSKDCHTWTRHPANPMVVDGFDARDPYIMRHGDQWIMYYTATTKPEQGNHCVAYVTSKDLIHWGNRGIAFVDPEVGRYGGLCESPQVIRRGDRYYLMLGPRNGTKVQYIGTDVYVSDNPFQWKIEDKVAHLAAHAPEIVRDTDGKWYISDCGWGRRGVYIAPLTWNDGLDDPETNIVVPKKK